MRVFAIYHGFAGGVCVDKWRRGAGVAARADGVGIGRGRTGDRILYGQYARSGSGWQGKWGWPGRASYTVLIRRTAPFSPLPSAVMRSWITRPPLRSASISTCRTVPIAPRSCMIRLKCASSVPTRHNAPFSNHERYLDTPRTYTGETSSSVHHVAFHKIVEHVIYGILQLDSTLQIVSVLLE